MSNGGFEKYVNTTSLPIPEFWGATDTTKVFGELMSKTLPPYYVPLSPYTYQWPRTGNNFLGSLQFCSTCQYNKRGYPRNRLKEALKPGREYCVTMYVNLTNPSTHAIGHIGAYFANNSIDTITNCNQPITYLIPQVVSPSTIVIADTLNWVRITGTFIASGLEKYMILGNFKSDNDTYKTLINPTNLPSNAASYCYDDVSVIETDLPAYAGPDHTLIPGDSAFIGREPDVGIDEACMWYQLPNDSVPIDVVAGLWVKPVGTATYMVRQQLNCGGVKWDTVVVHENPLGINSLFISAEGLKVYPNPADEILKIELRLLTDARIKDQEFDLTIYNNLGQVVKEVKMYFEENSVSEKTDDLPEGVYSLKLAWKAGSIRKRFIIAR